jgi:hypothetical protein
MEASTRNLPRERSSKLQPKITAHTRELTKAQRELSFPTLQPREGYYHADDDYQVKPVRLLVFSTSQRLVHMIAELNFSWEMIFWMKLQKACKEAKCWLKNLNNQQKESLLRTKDNVRKLKFFRLFCSAL